MLVESRPLGIRGFLIDSPTPGRVRSVRDGAIVIEDGLITATGDFESVRNSQSGRDIRWQHSPESVLVPGLIDLHTHLPQYRAVARHAETRQDWLEKHIFPIEKDFNAAAARTQAPAFFAELARSGTTTAMVHGTVTEQTTEITFTAAEASGLRLIIGKTMMDNASHGPLPPKRTPDQSPTESETLCRKWHGQDKGRLEYAFSPRFALNCSEDLMRRAADLARKHGAYVQTHLAESREEVEAVRKLFPGRASYAEVYAQMGLLGPKTILGHCIHLSDEEIRLLAETNCAVAHCPTSNFFLNSGIMPLARLRAAGLRIGLGSDVAGGPELNMWQVMRSAIELQKARTFHDESNPVPTGPEVFYMATQGGADALGKGNLIGSFEIGKEADLLVLDLAGVTPYGRKTNPHAHLTAEDVITLLVYRGGPSAVVETLVRGKSVYRAPAPLLV